MTRLPKKGYTYHVWAHFRYAEALLNYAEAANEYGGPGYVVPGAGSPLTPVEAIDMVRARAGMPDVASTFVRRNWTLNKENLRRLIRKERRVELAFEEHRYYDIRRWMEIEDGAIHGVKITQEGDKEEYALIEVEKKVFDPTKHYFFPIPYKEIHANRQLVQNPGWQ